MPPVNRKATQNGLACLHFQLDCPFTNPFVNLRQIRSRAAKNGGHAKKFVDGIRPSESGREGQPIGPVAQIHTDFNSLQRASLGWGIGLKDLQTGP